MVAATEHLPDLGQRQVGQLAAQVHRDLTGGDQDPGAGGPAQVLHRQPEVLRGRRHDGRAGDLRAPVGRDEVLEHHLGQREVDDLAVERGEGCDPDQRALQLADVARDLGGDELQYVRRRREAVLGGLLAQDRDARLEVGRLSSSIMAKLISSSNGKTTTISYDSTDYQNVW